MSDPYLVARWVHILSSTILFGTGIGTAFQMVWAMRTRRTEIVRAVASGVVTADWLFTLPAGILQPLTGLWLVHLAGHSLSEPWLLITYGLYLLAFLCWAPVVHLQLRIKSLATEAELNGTELPPAVFRAYRIWFLLGWPAFISLTGIFWLMVTRPPLWG